MQKITPFIWYENNAEEAVNFYISIFKDGKITNIIRNGENGLGPAGSVLLVNFELFGQQYSALNGGPQFQLNEAVSFVVHCDTQEELDDYWDKLSEGGSTQACGWLKDKYGLSWQIVPTVLDELLGSGDSEKTMRVMNALWQMIKLDIAELQKAYDQA